MATEHLQWGVSPLCWTNDVLEDLGGDIPLDTCLREAREAGYQGIELGRKFPRQAETLGPLLAAADLRLASGWYSGLLAERSVEAELEAVREHAQLLRQQYRFRRGINRRTAARLAVYPGLPAAISDAHHRRDRAQHHSGAAAGYAGGLRHSSTQPLATSERIIMLTWFMDPIHWFGEGGIFPLLAQHISYSAVALAIAFIIAFPVGCYTGHTGKGEGLLIGTTNALRSLPSFGLIILLVILLSGEFESDMAFILPCILVLVALALPPIALGVHAGIRALDPYVLDAARGMGMTRLQILLQVELPCALPLILSGVRSATLQIISTATIAAYVSLGGFGRLIIDGRAANDFSQMIAGAMLVALLALLIDCLFSFSQKIVVSPGITRRIKNP